jgi:hypothetical protein
VHLRVHHRGFHLGLSHCPAWALERPFAGFLDQGRDWFRRAGQRESITSESTTRHVSQEPRLSIALSLTFSAVPAPSKFPESFLAWLAILAGTLWLMILLRGRSSRLAWVVKKGVRVGISVCLLYGFWMLMNWKLLWVVLGPLGLTRRETGFWLMLGAILIWWVGVLWIVFSRPRRQQGIVADNAAHSVVHQDVSATADEVHSDAAPPEASKPLACRKGRNAGPQRNAPARNRRNRRDTDRTNHRYLN